MGRGKREGTIQGGKGDSSCQRKGGQREHYGVRKEKVLKRPGTQSSRICYLTLREIVQHIIYQNSFKV